MGRWVAAPLPRAGGEVLEAAEGPGGAGALAGRREVGGIAPKAGTHHPPAEPMSAPPPPCGPSGGRFAAVPLGVALFPRTGRAGGRASGPRGGVGRGVAERSAGLPGTFKRPRLARVAFRLSERPDAFSRS